MSMNSELSLLLFAFFGGLLSGAFFFGGLWWSVKRALTAKHPGKLLFKSFLLRCTVFLICLALITDLTLERILAYLAGFFCLRQMALRRCRLACEGKEQS